LYKTGGLAKSIPVSARPIDGLPIVSNGGGRPASVRVNVVLRKRNNDLIYEENKFLLYS